MNFVHSGLLELSATEYAAEGSSVIHLLHPLTKLAVTLSYIAVLSSFSRYALSDMLIFILYPVLVSAASGIGILAGLKRMRPVLPLIIMIGIFDPFFNREPFTHIGSVTISYGLISMATLLLRGILSLLAAWFLIATTDIYDMCRALRLIHVPELLVTLLLLSMRYIHVLMREAAVMTDAYHLRSPGQRGIRVDAWGSFLGGLTLRSIDRAQRIYDSMMLRGFSGDYPMIAVRYVSTADIATAIICIAVFIICRLIPVTSIIGSMVIR